MKRLFIISFIALMLMSGVSLAQDNQAMDEAKRIKEVCTEYYNQGKDCPYDSVDGVPIMINGDEVQYQRFEEDAEIEEPIFKSN